MFEYKKIIKDEDLKKIDVFEFLNLENSLFFALRPDGAYSAIDAIFFKNKHDNKIAYILLFNPVYHYSGDNILYSILTSKNSELHQSEFFEEIDDALEYIEKSEYER